MSLFFHFRKAQTDHAFSDEYDPLDEVRPALSPVAGERIQERASFPERMHAVIPAFFELFRHKAKPLLWPY